MQDTDSNTEARTQAATGATMERKYVMRPHEGTNYLGLGALVKRIVHPTTTGSTNLGVSICYMNPGDEIIRHQHTYEEAYFVVQGEGTMYLEPVGEIHLEPNMSVYIPGDTIHGQVNTGDVPLVIICSLSPPPPAANAQGY